VVCPNRTATFVLSFFKKFSHLSKKRWFFLEQRPKKAYTHSRKIENRKANKRIKEGKFSYPTSPPLLRLSLSAQRLMSWEKLLVDEIAAKRFLGRECENL
jgi:hypothetical protein